MPGVWGQSPRNTRSLRKPERAPPDERPAALSADGRAKGRRLSTDARREPPTGGAAATGRKTAPAGGEGLRNGRPRRTESGGRKPEARGKEQSGSHAPAGRREREHPKSRERRGARPSDEPRQRRGTRAGTERRATSSAKPQRPTTSGRKQGAGQPKGAAPAEREERGQGVAGGERAPRTRGMR